ASTSCSSTASTRRWAARCCRGCARRSQASASRRWSASPALTCSRPPRSSTAAPPASSAPTSRPPSRSAPSPAPPAGGPSRAPAAGGRPRRAARLDAALRDPATLEPELRQYLERRNDDTILIANIESVPAIQRLDDILSVPGLDAVLIGPHDLSCSLGIPEQYRHPRFDEAVRTIFRKARQHNVGAGIHFWESVEQEIHRAKAGGNLNMHHSDLACVGRKWRRALGETRSARGDPRRAEGDSGAATV